ncbi:peptidase domain-containing ABC transporter [Asticcacaulis sp. DXS10W]|uniref:Peptidase domain-containing ABC transporter n=1 Tax=Asticcacaulis currens TaxID=2984210 RepID=A0ABT5IBA7_9CAUL|nr:peptidase domain-containing ABC transporter [Asticcacaulis currens]MDC7693459.1 peptidase domain-containing ABC transporter [Asticcacaulis currens]
MDVMQTEATECGLCCLAQASARLGAHHDMAELRRRFPVSSRGLTLRQLSEIATALDMHARGVKCEVDELTALKLPAILHWGLNHFVVLETAAGKHAVIFDPARGRTRLRLGDVGKRFTGVALELSASPSFRKRSEKSPLSVWSWIRLTPDLYSGLAQVLLLSLVLQAYMVAAPFYMQLAIDQAALKGDQQLLITLAIGFGLFGLFNAGAGLLRSFAMQQIAAVLSWDMSLRLFRHLVRLPLGWFQRRRLADTMSRFDAINPIRDQVSGALISSLIDGALALATLIMMFVFAWPLGLCVVAATLIYIAVRLLSLSTSLRLQAENLTARISENGKRIETIKAIQTIKVMSAEGEQETQWSNRYASVVTKTLVSARFTLVIGGIHQAVDTVATTLVVFLGARAIIANDMTVGVLFAFMAYKGQFTSAITSNVEQLINWKLNDIYSYRLADIVLTPKEESIDVLDTQDVEFRGEIELENLSFRYGPHDPYVFRHLNLKIRAGEMIAIVGPSGAGKSSLLKVIAGLYPSTGGEVRIDGRPLAAWSPKTLRRAFGVVMQDDELLSGSIAENVAFFDERIDIDRVWTALEMAGLKDEIMAMPMKLESFVGDMGGALSGGQKQRLLIARALYRHPKILFLDEATSHLDVQNEARINASLKQLKVTRIIIAHRPETIRNADKVFDICAGQFVTPHVARPSSGAGLSSITPAGTES